MRTAAHGGRRETGWGEWTLRSTYIRVKSPNTDVADSINLPREPRSRAS